MERASTTIHMQRTEDSFKSEKGIITVEACTSLMIFVFAFYIILEMLKIYAVQICMQDLTTAVVMDCSMATYYKNKVDAEHQTMSNLCSYDYSDGRLEIADSIVNNNYGWDTSVMSIANYYMDDGNNLYRLVTDENVTYFTIDVRVEYSSGIPKVVGTCRYGYMLINIPFFDGQGIYMTLDTEAYSYGWTR